MNQLGILHRLKLTNLVEACQIVQRTFRYLLMIEERYND